MKTSILGLAVVAVVASLASGNAQAIRYDQNGSGTCNGALPFFDQNLRFRPLAVANIGSTNAFVTCTQASRETSPASATEARVYLHNTSSTSATVSCIYRPGEEVGAASPTAFPKNLVLAAGQTGFIIWTSAADNAGNSFERPANFSCNLPVGFELEFIVVDQTPDLI